MPFINNQQSRDLQSTNVGMSELLFKFFDSCLEGAFCLLRNVLLCDSQKRGRNNEVYIYSCRGGKLGLFFFEELVLRLDELKGACVRWNTRLN